MSIITIITLNEYYQNYNIEWVLSLLKHWMSIITIIILNENYHNYNIEWVL